MDDNDLWGLTARSRRGRHDRGAGEGNASPKCAEQQEGSGGVWGWGGGGGVVKRCITVINI